MYILTSLIVAITSQHRCISKCHFKAITIYDYYQVYLNKAGQKISKKKALINSSEIKKEEEEEEINIKGKGKSRLIWAYLLEVVITTTLALLDFF